MNTQHFSDPVSLRDTSMDDAFWQRTRELVRTAVIPYQWEALNDRIPEASKSWCIRNMKAASRLQQQKKLQGAQWIPPHKQNLVFEKLPAPGESPKDDEFYGFLFQDSDLYKWLEAVAYSLSAHPDKLLEETADQAIALMGEAQSEDGYLDTYYILNGMEYALTNICNNHEMYCMGHMTEAAVAYYDATGKDALLRIACRYVDWMMAHVGPEEGKKHAYPGHEIAEMALVRLWKATGEEKYLQYAQYLVNERGRSPLYFMGEAERLHSLTGTAPSRTKAEEYDYYQAHKPVREQDEAVGHAVRAMYLYSGMADIARLTRDDTLADACRRLWHSTANEKLYITGGVGGTHIGESFSYPYDLPNDTAYSETCAAIGLAFFARRMLQLEPHSEYADVMEMALYNTVIAGMALDGKSFFYVNPLQVDPAACKTDKRLEHVKPIRQKWFGCACCPPNIARIVSDLPQYVMTVNDTTAWLHLYVSGSWSFVLNGKPVQCTVKAGMPWCGKGTVTITAPEGAEGTIALRIPGWCGSASIGFSGKERSDDHGYVYLTGHWQNGETIEFDFSMPVRMLSAHTAVREDDRCVAFTRGPITYCAEEKDNGKQLHLLRVIPEQKTEIEEIISTEFGHEAVLLRIPGMRVVPQVSSSLYAEYTKPHAEETTITLIPYYTWANRGEGEMRVWLPV